MNWLTNIADELQAQGSKDEILIESGGSPSGAYHLGHMRELVVCDAILLELRRRGLKAKHIYFVDDLDVFRKVPANVPESFSEYLGMPLCDVPSPSGVDSESYADYFLQGLIDSCNALHIDVEFVRSHPKYRSGWFVEAIELVLEHIPEIKQHLEEISNRKLDPNWNPVQILENGRLKNREFVSLDSNNKTVTYINGEGREAQADYSRGEVKLDWRLDWPARWWLLNVDVEPYGREHASSGGSYDTGKKIVEAIFNSKAPLPVPYDSIHMAGDTKKMSASKGTAISAIDATEVMPYEVIRYFILRTPLNRPVYFDPNEGVVRLIDDFVTLMTNESRESWEDTLLHAASRGSESNVARIPFSHLVASYQAALRDPFKTLEVIERTEHRDSALEDRQVILTELKFIDTWLQRWAPEDVKFELKESVSATDFNQTEQLILKSLGDLVASAPDDADGEWFHKAIYNLKEFSNMPPKELFALLYRVIIGKNSGPRAGWFLSLLPRDWLVKRLRLEA